MVWPTFGSRTAKEQNRTYVTDLDESFNGLTVKSVNYSPYVTSYSSRCKLFYPRCGQSHSRSSAAMLFDKSLMISQWSCRVTIQYTSLKMERLWNSVAFALLCWLLLKQVYNIITAVTTRHAPNLITGGMHPALKSSFTYLLDTGDTEGSIDVAPRDVVVQYGGTQQRTRTVSFDQEKSFMRSYLARGPTRST